MKIVFVGPSAPDAANLLLGKNINLRPPTAQGDLAAAVLEGANVVGLVDGTFEHNAATWHKEILFALSQGVQVFGAASMGALRAAECAPFGMVGVGDIYNACASGQIIDDDAVAVIHAPEALGYTSLSVPFVNIEATCRSLREKSLLSVAEEVALLTSAMAMFFKNRSLSQVVKETNSLPSERRAEILELLTRHYVDLKRKDTIALIRAVESAEDTRENVPADWQFSETLAWRRLLDQVARNLIMNL